MYDTTEVADRPADLRTNEVDRTECKGGRTALAFPVCAAIVCMNDESALTDRPAVLVRREIDVPDAVPDIRFNFVPSLSAIITHRHRAAPADCDCPVRIRKLDVL